MRYRAATNKADHEQSTHGPKDRTATTGLLWLLRGLNFTATGLRLNVDDPKEEFTTSFTKAYDVTLKKYHGMMVRPIFYVRRVMRLRRD